MNKTDNMNKMNKVCAINEDIFNLNEELTVLRNSGLFLTDMFLYSAINRDTNYGYAQGLFGEFKSEALDLFLSMLWARVDEDMIPYECAEDFGKCDRRLTFDPMISVFANKYDFAKNIMDITEDYFFGRIVEEECWNFLEEMNEGDDNEDRRDMLIRFFVKDYLMGKDNIYRYGEKYLKDNSFTDCDIISSLLKEINSGDGLFEGICEEVYNVMLKKARCEDYKKFNERAVELMERCAELGLTLKKFTSFNLMLLPIEKEKEENSLFGSYEKILLPDGLARLIDENTLVSMGEDFMWKTMEQGVLAYDNEEKSPPTNFMYRCYFKDDGEADKSAQIDELQYICADYQRRYGKKLTVKLFSYDISIILNRLYGCMGMFELSFDSYVLEQFYDNTRFIRELLKYDLLSQNSIDEITRYFAEKVRYANEDDSVKKLNQLNKMLSRREKGQNE